MSNNSNDSAMEIMAQVLEEMKAAMGNDFSIEKVNLAELERRTGISRQRKRQTIRLGFSKGFCYSKKLRKLTRFFS